MKKCVLKITVFALLFVLISCTKKEENVAESEQIDVQQNQQEETDIDVQPEKEEETKEITQENTECVFPYERDEEGLLKFTEENKSADVFAPYFSKTLPNYDFLIRNPGFQESLYIENLDAVKNKIVKVEAEQYSLHNGSKYWRGDGGELQIKDWEYYFFDADGIITDVFNLYKEVPENGSVINWSHSKYHCDGEKRLVSSKDCYANKVSDSFSDLIVDGDKLLLKSQKRTYATEYYKDKTYFYPDYNNKSKFYEDIFSGNRYVKNEWRNGEIFGTNEYENGVLVKRQFPHLKQMVTETYELNGEEGFIKQDGEILKRVRRKMNPVGFVEEEEIGPVEDGADGVYDFIYIEILDAPDDILKKYFGFE